MSLHVCQYFSQLNVVSKFDVHMSSKVVMMYWNLKDWLELYIYETLREMCQIVNHVWTFFTKLSKFVCGNIMDKYMFSYHFLIFYQILILLLLL
jgi:hypothetical protein